MPQIPSAKKKKVESQSKFKKVPQHYATFPGPGQPVNPKIAAAVAAIEKKLGMRAVLFIQNGEGQLGTINQQVYNLLLRTVHELPKGSPVALVIQSPGGYAESAYRIAQLLRRHCGGFVAVVPHFAKSAATLLSLGADRIILGHEAELGPLDAQIDDLERERTISALEVVQSLERLNSEAMQAVDAQMLWWMPRCGKRVDAILPIATKFVAEMMRPLYEKLDTVQFTQMARNLKVGQDYAYRLLLRNYSHDQAEEIAATLTKNYPDHGFVIDSDEARRINLRIEDPPGELTHHVSPLGMKPKADIILGPLKEVSEHAQQTSEKQHSEQARTERDRSGTRNRNGEARSTEHVGRRSEATDNGEETID